MSAQGSSGRFSRIVETAISQTGVDGDFEFELNEHAPRNNLMDYFYFVDADSNRVPCVRGRVEVLLSPAEGIFQSVPNGVFSAQDSCGVDWPKPNGFGKAVAIRVCLSGVVGAVGFRSNITQSVD